MIFFDENNPNKYRELKKLLVPYKFSFAKTKVGNGDGGYVIDKRGVDTILSYGIGNDPEGVSFETEMLDADCKIHMYDGSIDEFPVDLTRYGGKPSFFSEYLTKDNFKNHVEKLKPHDPKSSILKMDIEGCEYDWLTKENLSILTEKFCQFTVEVHSLIEEVPEKWDVEPQLKQAKENPNKVLRFFQELASDFKLWHIHANNHSPRYVDFPDSLELTFLNLNFYEESEGIDFSSNYPIDGLDEPNYNGRKDYILDWWK